MGDVGERAAARAEAPEAPEAVERLREALIREAVAYDDMCRYWRREESVRIKVLAQLLEAVGSLNKAAEGFDPLLRGAANEALTAACADMVVAVSDHVERLLARPWPQRPASDDSAPCPKEARR